MDRIGNMAGDDQEGTSTMNKLTAALAKMKVLANMIVQTAEFAKTTES